ncbi:hypothetical protein IFR05_001835 [Cadophora sp. M221]|nr:hypothetical protein IFR05_001835 [Cadophora sp. M221]
MATIQSTHQFAEAATSQIQGLSSHHCELIIRQGPEHARVAIGKEKDRKPVDPPPILQLKISPQADSSQNFLQSPYFFMSCSLLPESDNGNPSSAAGNLGATLAGTLVSSLHRLKDTDNFDGAFFVFGDLSVKHEGRFRLQFTLYEMRQNQCAYIRSITSQSFPVHSTKNFPGMSESTFLTRSFSDQGVRLRLRKEPRTLLRKRGPAHDDYEPRHYRQGNRQPSTGGDRQSVPASEPQERPRRDTNDQGEYSEAQASWVQRPALNRHYSQHSAVSFQDSASNSYDDYQSAKRPRTGSDQSQSSSAFGQVHPSPLDTTAFPSRPYPESQQPSYSQYASTQPAAYGYAYTQSPQSANSSRPNFFSDRTGSTGTSSPFDPNLARSPQDSQFPPQPQAVRYGNINQLPFISQSSLLPGSRLDNLQHASQSMSLGPISPGYAAPNYCMPPPLGRMTSSTAYPGFPAPIITRRESYQSFSSPGTNPNMSAGNIGTGLYSQG